MIQDGENRSPPPSVPIDQLVAAFEHFDAIKQRPADPAEPLHRRRMAWLVAGLASSAVVAVLGVSVWIALDRENRYSDTMQQTAGGALLSLTSALVGYAVKR